MSKKLGNKEQTKGQQKEAMRIKAELYETETRKSFI